MPIIKVDKLIEHFNILKDSNPIVPLSDVELKICKDMFKETVKVLNNMKIRGIKEIEFKEQSKIEIGKATFNWNVKQ